MTPPPEVDPLRRFMEAAARVRTGTTERFDAVLCARIAAELGLSESDLAAVRAHGEAELARGQGLARHGVWDEAIERLDEAEALLPDDPRVLEALGAALLGRWKRDGREPDCERARATGRRALELNPRHEPAFALLRSLDARRPMSRGRQRLLGVAIATVFVACVAGFIVFKPHKWRGPGCPDGRRSCDLPVMIQWGESSLDLGLVGGQLHFFEGYPTRLAFRGRVLHEGNTELEHLGLTVRLLDGQGAELARMPLEAMPKFRPPLRPGDTQPFYFAEKVPSGTRAVALDLTDRQVVPAAPTYGPPAPLEVVFAGHRPAEVLLTAGWRTRQARRSGGRTVLEGVVEVVNGGAGVIRTLEMAIEALDAAGEPVKGGGTATFASVIMPPMLAGERRIARIFAAIEGEVASERLRVKRVE